MRGLMKCTQNRQPELVIYGKQNTLTNFEFIMNRAYALNRDKLQMQGLRWLAYNRYAIRTPYQSQSPA